MNEGQPIYMSGNFYSCNLPKHLMTHCTVTNDEEPHLVEGFIVFLSILKIVIKFKVYKILL